MGFLTFASELSAITLPYLLFALCYCLAGVSVYLQIIHARHWVKAATLLRFLILVYAVVNGAASAPVYCGHRIVDFVTNYTSSFTLGKSSSAFYAQLTPLDSEYFRYGCYYQNIMLLLPTISNVWYQIKHQCRCYAASATGTAATQTPQHEPQQLQLQ